MDAAQSRRGEAIILSDDTGVYEPGIAHVVPGAVIVFLRAAAILQTCKQSHTTGPTRTDRLCNL